MGLLHIDEICGFGRREKRRGNGLVVASKVVICNHELHSQYSKVVLSKLVVDQPSVESSPSIGRMRKGKVGLKTKKRIRRRNPQCLSPTPNYTEDIHENLKIFDKLFSEFEFSYVSCMVHVKTVKGKIYLIS